MAHIDHGLTPESADVAEQVMGLAFRYSIPGVLKVLDIGHGDDVSETTARDARYGALRELQSESGARYLVTAHHADDQIETVLFRVLRGSAPAGLAGIPAVRDGGLTRPLLPFRRVELDEWRKASNRWLPVHQDPANLDRRHDRSWIRTELLPQVRKRFGIGVEENLLNVALFAGADRRAWQAVLSELPGLDSTKIPGGLDVAVEPLIGYDKSLGQAILRALAQKAGFVLGPERAARLLDFARNAQSGRRMELGQRWVGEIAFGRLRLQTLQTSPQQSVLWGEEIEGLVGWGGWEILWKREPAGRVTRSGWTTWVDGVKGGVRSFVPGDRLGPFLGQGRRPVRRVLMEARVPRSQRMRYPMVTYGDQVLWVPGLCRSGLAVPEEGQAATRLEVRRKTDGASEAR